MRREEKKETGGGWNQRGKRRRQKPKFYGTEWVPEHPDGEGHHERVQVKSFRRKSDAPGEEVKSPRRKVIRVESEDTQDYVTEAKDLDQEEAEEISFVPSALSVRNRCSEKTLSFWQFASVVTKEGEESYTTNLCQQCCKESPVARGDKPLTKWAVVRV